MKNLIIVCTLFITNQVFAQLDFRKEYYPVINRAEMAITKDDYQTAFTEYQTAFSAVKTPLARDIFNAVACKFLLNDFEGAKPLLLKLARKGISTITLEKKEVFLMDNIRSQWNSFKFLYEQIQSMQQEKIIVGLSDKLTLYNSVYDTLNVNSVTFFLGEDGKGQQILSKDLNSSRTNKALTKKELDANYLLMAGVSNELFIKAQKTLVEYVISEGFVAEEGMFVEDSDFLRNSFAWNIEKYRFRMDFRYGGGYSTEVKPFSAISDEKKKEFDYKILESVSQGKIHRDLALKYLFGYRANNKLLFTKINIENIENCSLDLKEKTYSLFYYKKTGQTLDDESQRTLEELQYGDSNLIFEKAKYKILKNSYFSMSSDAQMEETTVPNCDIAKQIIEKATIIQD
ncbi:hypothetical protein EGI26_07500 [Lacihabitans sp. CCS-44]|uniref:hypothetical protein n=3 Tax=Lacihabitans sp. CCS-44 TaxID=2487331 RepID=UPI0020CDA7A8|nr:hypothetical protein [Lacihabitans sp. CCS-44]MCP9754559.1 hypothetical protein [Lacihabitans sp. CCS-44]MCP9754996.1 hypothetical protein [Lacihabitans sp. CCS-44]